MKNTLKAKSEQDWQAESDARALLDAQVILNDSVRLKKAKPELKRIVETRIKEVVAARKAEELMMSAMPRLVGIRKTSTARRRKKAR